MSASSFGAACPRSLNPTRRRGSLFTIPSSRPLLSPRPSWRGLKQEKEAPSCSGSRSWLTRTRAPPKSVRVACAAWRHRSAPHPWAHASNTVALQLKSLFPAQLRVPAPHRGLTPRSTRGPTAWHQAREAVWYIIGLAGLAPTRRARVTSNVRRHHRTVGDVPPQLRVNCPVYDPARCMRSRHWRPYRGDNFRPTR